jgi:hypothetical protein
MELETKSPFGEPSHFVVARLCGVNRCRRTTPCEGHEQVIVRLAIDGVERPEFKLAKPAFHELEQLHRDPRELFHMLADFAVLADTAKTTLPVSAAVDAINHRACKIA